MVEDLKWKYATPSVSKSLTPAFLFGPDQINSYIQSISICENKIRATGIFPLSFHTKVFLRLLQDRVV